MAKARVSRDGDDLIRMYLNDIGRYSLLSREDEVRLAQQIEQGDAARQTLTDEGVLAPETQRELRRLDRDGEAAQQTLVQANLRLVVSIAKRYQASGLPLLDLIQEGNLGLLHAVGKFDWRRGFKFSTYATWWIRQAVSRGISSNMRTVRLPVNVRDRLVMVQETRSRLELKFGRRPTVREIAIELEMSEQKVADFLAIPTEPLSLSGPVGEDGDAELGQFVEDRMAESPFDGAANALLPGAIERLLAPLDEREREVLALRFGLDHGEPRTLEQVGTCLNLTRERIRQIEARAIGRLRDTVDIGAHDLLAV